MVNFFSELFENPTKELEQTPADIIFGTVINIDNDEIVIRNGSGSEFSFPIDQFIDENGNLIVSAGDEVQVTINDEDEDEDENIDDETGTEYLYLDFEHAREDDPRKKGRYGKGLDSRLSELRKKHGEALFKNWDETQDKLLDYILHQYFPEDLLSNFYLSNLSLSRGYWRLMIRLPDSPKLQNDLPHGLTAAFIGEVNDKHSNNPSITIRDIKVVAQTELLSFEREVKCDVALNRNAWEAKNSNVLSRAWLNELPPISKKTRTQLDEWRSYLDFKKQVIQHQELGVRYLKIQTIGEEQRIGFIVCFEQGDNTVNRLKRQQLSCYDLSISSDLWKFNPAIENNRRRTKDIRLGDIVNSHPLDKELSKALQGYLKDSVFKNPQFMVMTFELSDDDKEELDKSILTQEATDEWINDKFPEQGFIAISTAGDRAQVNRHERSLNQLEQQSGYNPMLSAFLFDIKEARTPESVKVIDRENMLNTDLNEHQKNCVEKMMSAPDVCLVQGPPGTGKTTVIAEAIYQMVGKGERVLLVSQANLAVDNALERLPLDPAIRALRLGRDSKISAEGKAFSKNNILKRFYQGIDKQVYDTYHACWESLEDRQNKSQHYLDKLMGLDFDLKRDLTMVNSLEKDKETREVRLIELREEFKNQTSEYKEKADKQQLASIALKALLEDNWLQCTVHGIASQDWVQQVSTVASLLRGHGFVMGLPLPKSSDSFAVLLDYCQTWLHRTTNILRYKQVITDDFNHLANGNDVINTTAAMEIAKLKERHAELTELLQSGDDTIIDEWRRVSNEIRDLESKKGGIDRTVYQNFVSENSLLLSSNYSLAEAYEELNKLVKGITLLEQQRPLLIAQLKDQLSDACQQKITEPDRKLIEQAELEQEKVKRELHQWQEKSGILREKIRGLLQSAVDEGLPVDQRNVNNSIDGLKNYVSECKERLDGDDTKKHWKPLLDRWHNILTNNDLASDNEHFLKDFIPHCNVIAITCNESERTLEDIGAESFDTVIIDEVSKATPPEMLMPIMRGRRVIFVGDHRQLPPVFQERHDETWEEAVAKAEEDGEELLLTKKNLKKYEKMVTASLFKQHFEEADNTIKSSLFTQYRMHPQIMDLINVFYENRLECGLSDPNKERAHNLTVPSAKHKSLTFIRPETHAYWINSGYTPDRRPYFEQQAGTSKINPLEVQLIVKALQEINDALQELNPNRNKEKNSIGEKKRVGVISFYGRQVSELRRAIKPLRSNLSYLDIDVNTVDRFQGKEEDIIFVSMVRNTPSGRSGSGAYVAQFERINVALSRARQMLIIFGAREMFADYEVVLPNLDSQGVRKRRVYKDIIDRLAQNNALFDSDHLLNPDRDKKILEKLKEDESEHSKVSTRNRRKDAFKGKGRNRR